jgi:hypothetical protein
MKTILDTIYAFLLIAALATGAVLVGCDDKESIVDIDTPNGGVEVERDRDDGGISVDVSKDE